MKVTMNNVGKIFKAEIMVSGLTVIAAPNNTGKSTIGKALFAAFDAFANFQNNVCDDKANSIGRILRQKYPSLQKDRLVRGSLRISTYFRRVESAGAVLARYLVQMCNKRFVSEQDLVDALYQAITNFDDASYVNETSCRYYYDNKDEFVEVFNMVASDLVQDSEESKKTRMEILNYLNVDINVLSAQLIDRYFDDFFKGQFASEFIDSPNQSSLILENHSGDIIRKFSFIDGKCVEASPAEDEHRRVFILDDPRIPELFGHDFFSARSDARYVRRLLEVVADQRSQVEENPVSGLTEAVSNSEAVQQIVDMLDSSFSGCIGFNEKDFPVLSTDAPVREPIRLSNTSMGVKAYTALRYLLENAIVHDGDILVLDEPEIHLHPEWQVAYAHALVLAAKLLGIRLVITTHSPFFLKALVAYSGTEGIEDATHYYTAEENPKGPVSFYEIDNEGIAELYARMAAPLMKINEDVYHG